MKTDLEKRCIDFTKKIMERDKNGRVWCQYCHEPVNIYYYVHYCPKLKRMATEEDVYGN